MKAKKLTALLLTAVLTACAFTGCGNNQPTSGNNGGGTTQESNDKEEVKEEKKEEKKSDDVIEFTAFFTMAGSEINDDNEVAQMIADKTGVRVKETWLTGQTSGEAVGTIMAADEYPDFIDGGDGMVSLYEAGALVAWDEYIEKYPNIKEFYTDEEWDRFRMDDGKIYWCNPFENTYGADKATEHGAEAFWIQTRVLKWDNYPQINTMDQYFDLLERYMAANPNMEDGTPNIAYTILCEDWKYFCLENAPQFLDGYPNDGSVMVDMDTKKVMDYNTSATAKKYFAKLNEEYQKGFVDPESFTQTYDEYIAKLSTGRVLGMIDQWWDFAFTVNDVFKQQGLDKQGCNYVPLGITIEEGMNNQWHTTQGALNVSSGLGITKDCKDVEAAFKFVSDLLDQDLHDLRFWGVEGVDYLVDDNGLYYRTAEMRMNCADPAYKASHLCTYSYFPQWYGTSKDGKNAMMPKEQPSEFQNGLNSDLVDCFKAYGVDTYVGMVHSTDNIGCWYPMYSYSNSMTTDTQGGVAWTKMGETKHEWLPQVVMADDFEGTWATYMEKYAACKPEDFLAEMQEELDRRIAADAK